MNILYFILGLSVLVLVHEFGHFIWAKIFGVYVYEFSLFMGPKLFQIKGKETKYTLRLLPIGGYCSLAGEEDSQSNRNEKERIVESIKNETATNLDIEQSVLENKTVEEVLESKKQDQIKQVEENIIEVPNERSLLGICWWKKIIIMAAGGINNIILCFLMLFIYYSSIKAPYVNISTDSIAYQTINQEYIEVTNATYTFYEKETGKFSDEEGSSTHLQGSLELSYSYGFTSYEYFESIYSYGYDYIYERMTSEDALKSRDFSSTYLTEEFKIYVEGKDNPYVITRDFIPTINETNDGIVKGSVEDLGFSCSNNHMKFSKAFKTSYQMEGYMAGLIYRALGNLFTKEGMQNVSGIVGMYNISKTYASKGFNTYLFYLATISVNLGIMNLLPFPALDGGKIVLTIIEAITKKKTNAKTEGIINIIGFALLMGLMVIVTIKDIINL